MVTLRFGNSLVLGHRPIIDEMSERFPATLELVIPASILALLIGVLGGTVCGFAPQTSHRLLVAHLFRFHLFAAYLLVRAHVPAPVRGAASSGLPISGRIDPVLGASLKTHYKHLHHRYPAGRKLAGVRVRPAASGGWPTITLGLILSGVFVRITRINVIETLQADYIAAGRAPRAYSSASWSTDRTTP